MKHELVLTEEQGGVAGVGGTIWRISPDGVWSSVSFRRVDGRDCEFEQTRRVKELNPDRVVGIARQLKEQRFLAWPKHLGPEEDQNQGVNLHRYTIRFGEKETLLSGVEVRRGGSIERNIVQGSPPMGGDELRVLGDFANLARVIIEDRP